MDYPAKCLSTADLIYREKLLGILQVDFITDKQLKAALVVLTSYMSKIDGFHP